MPKKKQPLETVGFSGRVLKKHKLAFQMAAHQAGLSLTEWMVKRLLQSLLKEAAYESLMESKRKRGAK